MSKLASHKTIRVLGIDPGTDTLGAVAFDFSLESEIPHLVFAQTVTAHQFVKTRFDLIRYHGPRFARLIVLREFIAAVVKTYCPHFVGVESPFLRDSPTAFAALTEAFLVIRQGLVEVDTSIPLLAFDPMRAKCAVGAASPTETVVKKRGKRIKKVKIHSKTTVREAVLKLAKEKAFTWDEHVDLEALDEHSIDAIAVCFALMAKLRLEAGRTDQE